MENANRNNETNLTLADGTYTTVEFFSQMDKHELEQLASGEDHTSAVARYELARRFGG
jgi:hypothetical protein